MSRLWFFSKRALAYKLWKQAKLNPLEILKSRMVPENMIKDAQKIIGESVTNFICKTLTKSEIISIITDKIISEKHKKIGEYIYETVPDLLRKMVQKKESIDKVWKEGLKEKKEPKKTEKKEEVDRVIEPEPQEKPKEEKPTPKTEDKKQPEEKKETSDKDEKLDPTLEKKITEFNDVLNKNSDKKEQEEGSDASKDSKSPFGAGFTVKNGGEAS